MNAISRPFGDQAGIVSCTLSAGSVIARPGTGAVVCTISVACLPPGAIALYTTCEPSGDRLGHISLPGSEVMRW
jgi:hypothetical protein